MFNLYNADKEKKFQLFEKKSKKMKLTLFLNVQGANLNGVNVYPWCGLKVESHHLYIE